MELSKILSIYNESHIIERIHEGDNLAFSNLYERCRNKFFGYFRKSFPEGNREELLADLYQNSCLKLYNQIITGKLFVQDKSIYLRNKEGKINVLSAKLETYLIGIGKFSFKEMQRGERKYVDFDPFANVLSIEDYNPADGIHVNPILEIADDSYFEDETKFTVVRNIVDEMGSPCKEIFTYTYFSENGERMKGDEIAEKMGYASADVVKNQKSRCHKKFKEAYEKALSEQ